MKMNNTFTTTVCTAGSGRQRHPVREQRRGDTTPTTSTTTTAAILTAAGRLHPQSQEGGRSTTTQESPRTKKGSHYSVVQEELLGVRLATSRQEVHAHRQEQQFVLVNEAANATSMLPLSHNDQKIALMMLVSEAWRYNTHPRVKAHRRQVHGAPQRTSPITTPHLHIPGKIERAALCANFACLLNDVRLLMASPLWLPDPEPTAESHPYLYTRSQIVKQRCFTTED